MVENTAECFKLRFLQTEAGEFIAAKYIVKICGLNSRPNREWHEVHYVHGSEACTATVSAQVVSDFLEEQNL